MKKKQNKSQKKSSQNRALTLSETLSKIWSQGKWVDRPKDIPLSYVDYEGAKENIPENPSQIPQYIESLPNPKLKECVRAYLAYREKQRRWEIPISDNDLKRLEKLSDSGEFDQYHEELAKIIESWMKGHAPKDLSELLQPDKKREKELEAMAKPFSEGGLGIPFPRKYPFGTYFLTLNILAKLYGLSPEIMEVVFTKISKIYRGAKKKQPNGKGVEILSGQAEKYEEIIECLSRIEAWKIRNLEWYINKSLKNWFSRGESKKEIPFTDLPQAEDSETYQEKVDRIIWDTIYFQDYSHYPDERILAEESKKELKDQDLVFKKIFYSLPRRQREVVHLAAAGLSQNEIATRVHCNVRTVKRDLKQLRSNPRFRELFKKDKDLRSE